MHKSSLDEGTNISKCVVDNSNCTWTQMGGKHKKKIYIFTRIWTTRKNRHSNVENLNRTLSPSDNKKSYVVPTFYSYHSSFDRFYRPVTVTVNNLRLFPNPFLIKTSYFTPLCYSMTWPFSVVNYVRPISVFNNFSQTCQTCQTCLEGGRDFQMNCYCDLMQ